MLSLQGASADCDIVLSTRLAFGNLEMCFSSKPSFKIVVLVDAHISIGFTITDMFLRIA
jgi:hypothetical protein